MPLKPKVRLFAKLTTGGGAVIAGLGWILNVISAWLTVESSRSKFDTPVKHLLVAVTNGYMVGTAFAVVVLCFLFYLFSRDSSPIHKLIHKLILRAVARGYQASWADPADAADVWRLCASYYKEPHQVIKYGPLKTFMEARDETALIIKGKNPEVRCGLFIVFSLNKAGMEAINSGEVESAQDFKREHAAANGEKVHGLYVTNICGNDSMWMSALIENQLYHHLYVQAVGKNVRWIYGRKGAPDGIRMMDKAEFKPTNPKGPLLQIWKLSRRDFLKQFEERFGWKGGTGLPIVSQLSGWCDHPRLPVAPAEPTSAADGSQLIGLS